MTFYKGQKFNRPKRKKHAYAKGSVRTTLKQRKELQAVRRELALMGYQIYPVALWFRRSQYDFLAVPRQHPNLLLLVRPTHRQKIQIMYYAFKGLYRYAKATFDARKDCGKVLWGRQLPAKDKGNDWRLYISRRCLLELTLFTNS